MGEQTFGYNGGDWHKFNVPAGVKILNVTMDGGGGTDGVTGGRVIGRMRVDGRDVLFIRCGQVSQPATGTNGRNGGDATTGGGGEGGNGLGTGLGGASGGGATIIRMNARDGRIVAVAGGAGGRSGDGGLGGLGGAAIGESGFPGTPAGAATAASTGGTQNQGGRGGTTLLGTAYYGKSADGGKYSRGGSGGTVAGGTNINGGGGGGGGYYPGGGGQAGAVGLAPAGGGAGGSNFAGGLYSVDSRRGAVNATGNGSVTITWENPGGNTPPVPPENIVIEGKSIQNELATGAMNNVTLKGTPKDPDGGGDREEDVRLLVRISQSSNFKNFRTFNGTFDESEKRDIVQIRGLNPNTLYYVRIYTQDHRKKISTTFRATSFWTNRPPRQPLLQEPTENAQFTPLVNVTFSWEHRDPDDSADQGGFQIRYRVAATPAVDAGPWSREPKRSGATESWVFDAGTFRGHEFYEWQVRTQDKQGLWGDWSEPNSFYVASDTQAPLLAEPIANAGVAANKPTLFRWQYRSPLGLLQQRADLRYRHGDDQEWITLTGDTTTPGADPFLTVAADTFAASRRYEWQVRTYSSPAAPSDWSTSAYFYAVATPGEDSGEDLVTFTPAAPLGQGNNRAFIYERGGTRLVGEIKGISNLRWGRKRDDISGCLIRITQWDDESKRLLRSVNTWMHEVVVFRDNGEGVERVWEGPITRISGSRDFLEIEAKDVNAYVYRRILRQGYSDAYRLINGIQVGQKTVVERAGQIIMNALAYDDPNVLPYLTLLNDPFDARTSRVVKDYTKTAWDELDDLAANAGLDYVTVGRRIILWDTHFPVGRLPEMRSGDFSDPPIVTEYGMNAANVFGVTNNSGVYGLADRLESVERVDVARNEFPTASGAQTGVSSSRSVQTVTVSSEQAWNGTTSWKNAHLGTSNDQYHRIVFTNATFAGGQTRTFRIRVFRPVTNTGTYRDMQVIFRDAAAGLNYVSGVVVTPVGDPNAKGRWCEFKVTHTVPNNRTLTAIYFDLRVNNRGASDVAYFDGIQSHDGPYFDGDTPDTFDVTSGQGFIYEWTGTPGNSISRQYSPAHRVVPPQGFLEQLASSYGEEEIKGGTATDLDRDGFDALEENLAAQAGRNIAPRWPPPVHVRIPDNATLSPHLNLTINQLIPGVWIPLRASGGIREVSQWQKLDSMTVEQTAEGEKISVVMSPAPNAGDDPDADAAAEEV